MYRAWLEIAPCLSDVSDVFVYLYCRYESLLENVWYTPVLNHYWIYRSISVSIFCLLAPLIYVHFYFTCLKRTIPSRAYFCVYIIYYDTPGCTWRQHVRVSQAPSAGRTGSSSHLSRLSRSCVLGCHHGGTVHRQLKSLDGSTSTRTFFLLFLNHRRHVDSNIFFTSLSSSWKWLKKLT